MAFDRRLGLIAGFFALSGCASLMDQVVWLRFLALSFGNTTYAAATLLAVFMGGLGLGALLFGRWADRLRRPLLAFAAVQIGVALFAVASPAVFAWIDSVYVVLYQHFGSQPLLFAVGRALLAIACLLPPTLLMGGTLPLVLRGSARLDRTGEASGSEDGKDGKDGKDAANPGRDATAGRRTALLYAVNTLGAVAGVALAGFVTIRLTGLHATLLLAAMLDLTAGLGCLLLSKTMSAVPPSKAAPEGPNPPDLIDSIESGGEDLGDRWGVVSRRGWLLTLFFLMGATSLAFEVLWTRALVFYLGSSVYAYSLMLLLFLVGVGLGSLAVAPWVDRLRPRGALWTLAWLEAGIGVWAVVQVVLFDHLNGTLVAAAGWVGAEGFSGIAMAQLLALTPLLLPPTIAMGASFPLAVKALHRRGPRLGLDVGQVYASNTFGSVCGSLGAGFVLIPLFGTQGSLIAVGVANTLLAAVLWLAPEGGGRADAGRQTGRRAAVALALLLPLVVLGIGMALPPDRVVLGAGMFRHNAPEDLVYFHEDVSSSVTIRRLDSKVGPYLSLELNGVNVAGTSPDLFAVQKMQGHLPLLLAKGAKEVVHIGFGSGGTAHAVSLHPTVEEILIVEISPAVLSASDRFFSEINHGVLGDPRVRVELNDGRNFMLASPRTFDAVLSDSIHPRYSGNGSLYSLEYFRLLKERLHPEGVVSMWLPTYSLTPRNYKMIVKAFAEVFPNTTVWYEPSALNAFTIVTGRLDDTAWDLDNLRRNFQDPKVAEALGELGIYGPAEVLGCYLIGGEALHEWLKDIPPHDDDLPAVEYESGALLHREAPWLAIFTELLTLRPAEPPAAYLAPLPEAEQRRARTLWDAYTQVMERHREFLRDLVLRDLGRGAGGSH